MQTVKSVSWVRMVLAFGAVLLIAGSGLAIAAGPGAAYVPTSSVIVGPSTVAHSSATGYSYSVTFNDGSTFSFPASTGPGTPATTATFSALFGTISPVTGNPATFTYNAPATGTRDKITASYTQNGVTTSASRFIFLQP